MVWWGGRSVVATTRGAGFDPKAFCVERANARFGMSRRITEIRGFIV